MTDMIIPRGKVLPPISGGKVIPKGRMLTLAEAAEFLDRRPDTLRQQAGRGIFRARKAGRDWIVSPAEVERYREAHRRQKRAERGLTTS